MVDSFGLDVLSEHGVLDVAGGRGEVSMALAQAGIPSLVIDPRENAGCLNPRLRKAMKKQNLPKLQAWHIYFPPPPTVECLQSESEEAKLFAAIVDNSKVVLGMHPDEATESIVDWAISNKKGFCIVPCCVFARLFPNRRLPTAPAGTGIASGSRQVRTHADLCEYLLRKHPGIRCSQLNFEGMNTCLWATAQDLA